MISSYLQMYVQKLVMMRQGFQFSTKQMNTLNGRLRVIQVRMTITVEWIIKPIVDVIGRKGVVVVSFRVRCKKLGCMLLRAGAS